MIEVMVRKYARRVLTRLEQKGLITPEIRGIILDGFNDLLREFQTKAA
jgi:hypothetical protein